MDIGKEREVIEIEPILLPGEAPVVEPLPEPVTVPERDKELVPA